LEERYNVVGIILNTHTFFAFSNAFACACSGRCFAITENGYMVIASPGAREGDMLCILMGAYTPLFCATALEIQGRGVWRGKFLRFGWGMLCAWSDGW
jgi:hypothetical protein